MSEFHRDDYIEYLSRITPGNENEFGALMQRCKYRGCLAHMQ